MTGRRARGSLEDEVLDVLIRAGEPRTVAQVAQALGPATAYTTVMTTLARLHDKGALSRERRGRGYRYSMAGPATAVGAAVAARQMHRLLGRVGQRSDVLARFVAELQPGDDEVLRDLLSRPERTVERP